MSSNHRTAKKSQNKQTKRKQNKKPYTNGSMSKSNSHPAHFGLKSISWGEAFVK
jgi:hypothetical protein